MFVSAMTSGCHRKDDTRHVPMLHQPFHILNLLAKHFVKLELCYRDF